jgi:hypothetical protein
MTFEKWWADFQETDEYKRDSFYWDDAAKAVWQAATLAERERAAKVAETHDADYWDDHAGQDIAAAIRKGEGV